MYKMHSPGAKTSGGFRLGFKGVSSKISTSVREDGSRHVDRLLSLLRFVFIP